MLVSDRPGTTILLRVAYAHRWQESSLWRHLFSGDILKMRPRVICDTYLSTLTIPVGTVHTVHTVHTTCNLTDLRDGPSADRHFVRVFDDLLTLLFVNTLLAIMIKHYQYNSLAIIRVLLEETL